MSATKAFLLLLAATVAIGCSDGRAYKQELINTAQDIASAADESMLICAAYSEEWRKSLNSEVLSADLSIFLKKKSFENDGTLAKAGKANSAIVTKMKTLNDPPRRYSQAYQRLLDAYGRYSQLYGLAQSPFGSLLEYNKRTGDLRMELGKALSELAVSVPN